MCNSLSLSLINTLDHFLRPLLPLIQYLSNVLSSNISSSVIIVQNSYSLFHISIPCFPFFGVSFLLFFLLFPFYHISQLYTQHAFPFSLLLPNECIVIIIIVIIVVIMIIIINCLSDVLVKSNNGFLNHLFFFLQFLVFSIITYHKGIYLFIY